MSNKGNDWGVTNPRVVRRGSITNFFRIEEEEGIRSTGLNKKNNNSNNDRIKIKPHKKTQKRKKQTKLQDLGFTSTLDTKHRKDSQWGDSYNRKPETIIRIISHNINRMPLNKNRDKNKRLWQAIQGKDLVDIHLYQEIGINWSQVKRENNLYNRKKD